jgi:hypothetical protein
MGSPLLTVAEVARLLQIPRRSVLRLPIARTVLGPRTIRFQAQDITDYIERSRDATWHPRP